MLLLLVAQNSDVIVLAHSIPQLTVIHTHEPLFNSINHTLLGHCNVVANTIQLPGPGTRRLERRVSMSADSTSVNMNLLVIYFDHIKGWLFFIRYVFGGREKEVNCLPGHR